MVRTERLELSHLAAPEPKPGVSTNFTTSAWVTFINTEGTDLMLSRVNLLIFNIFYKNQQPCYAKGADCATVILQVQLFINTLHLSHVGVQSTGGSYLTIRAGARMLT